MNDNTQPTGNTPESEERHLRYLMPMSSWIALFFIGCVSLALAIGGTVYNAFDGHGVQNLGLLLAIVQPIFFGIPATLLSLICAFAFRLDRYPPPRAAWLAYFACLGCILPVLLLVGSAVFITILDAFVDPLIGILFVPLMIGIPATVLSIKSALAHRPNRLHVSAMLLLAHVLVYAVNFVLSLVGG